MSESSSELLANPPRMFTIQQDLNAVRIMLPRRVTTDVQRQNRMLFAVVGFAMLSSLLGFILSMSLEMVGMAHLDIPWWATLAVMGTLMLAMFGASVLPFGLFLFGHRRISAEGQVTLDQRLLRMKADRREDVEIPLESVHRIEIETNERGERGRLRFFTEDGQIELFDGLFVNELEWLAGLIEHHTNRQRQHLLEQGEDLDAPVRLPRALIELTRRQR